MLCREIMNRIEKFYSRDFALEWDNVGLLAGRDDKEVKTVYVALDATDEVVDEAVSMKADLLITHHPLIFGGRKKITNEDFIGNRLIKLIQNDISYYAMHTNYDVMGMAELSGEILHMKNAEVLEVTGHSKPSGESEAFGLPEGIGRIADLKQEITLQQCADEVKKAFSLESVKVFGDLRSKMGRIAVCPGSGKSVIGTALEKKADVLITGDIGHHEGIDAVAQGLSIIDAGHYGIEHIFVQDMKRFLIEQLAEVRVEGEPVRHPFTVI